MRQLRWWRAAAVLAGVERRPSGTEGRCDYSTAHPEALWRCVTRHAPGLSLWLSEDMGLRVQRRLLLAEVHLLFANVDSRPIRVRRASQVPQGRVPRGVLGKAR